MTHIRYMYSLKNHNHGSNSNFKISSICSSANIVLSSKLFNDHMSLLMAIFQPYFILAMKNSYIYQTNINGLNFVTMKESRLLSVITASARFLMCSVVLENNNVCATVIKTRSQYIQAHIYMCKPLHLYVTSILAYIYL